jgi:transcriptional regulator with XRE-family HTH domain
MLTKPAGRPFGKHIRTLRRARGMTQEVLAEQCGLSPDTIRRMEHGSFSPSLDTIGKLCVGLGLRASTLFESFELGEQLVARELVDLLAGRNDRDLALATRVLRAMFDDLDGIPLAVGNPGVSPDDDEVEDAAE